MLWFGRKKQFQIDKFIKEARKFDPYEIGKYEPLFRYLQENRQAVRQRRLGLRLILISDTHGHLAFGENRFPAFMDTVGEYDLCILLGDIHPADMPCILDCIPREKIIGVLGNHDPMNLYRNFGITDISGRVFDYRGVRFAGLDGSFRYKNEDYPLHTQYESLMLGHHLPEAEVFLTHDIMLDDFCRDPAHSGLIGIAHYIYQKLPAWHFHGHIHRSYQRPYDNGTVEKSVYLCECVEI